MAELTVEMTYGSALYQAARELGKEKQILEDAEALLQIFRDSPDLPAMLNNPTIPGTEKKELLGRVFHGQMTEELLHFLYILVDKRRMGHFQGAVKVLRSMIDQEHGVSYGTILSVNPLTKERIQAFETETGKLMGSRVSLKNEIDPSLIGGVKVYVNGKVFDASLRTRLEQLEHTIK